jgi:hypothetical protein
MFTSFLFVLIGLILLCLLIRGVKLFRSATGTVFDRLAAAWWGSLTIFVLAWGAILSLLTSGLDNLALLTADPQFSSFSDSVKDIIPVQYHPYIPPTIMGLAIVTRLSHNPPTPPVIK